MWIYTDIIEAQYVADIKTPLLRIIPMVQKKDKATIGVVYDFPLFFKLKQSILSTIDILITSSSGINPVDFGDDEVIIGLVFRKCV
jgi:hypothetical protein